MDLSGYLKAVDAVDAVAFDVFDTLIVRPFFDPHDLFGFLEAKSGLEGFERARVAAERKARETDPETDLDGIYGCIDPMYRVLKECEVESEVSLSRADPEALKVLEYALEHGKKVVAVSDMYLSSDTIGRILSKNGISGHSGIYVSSETKASKRSGLMYDIVLGDLGIGPSRLLMLGDNPRSDYSSALSKGLSAERWISMKERYAACHRHEMRFLRKHSGYGSSLIVGMDMFGWADHPEETYWHMVSRRFGGPMNVMFARFIMEHTNDTDLLVFFSRDGYMPMKVYELLGGRKPSVYLHTSRMIAKVFGARNLSDRDTAVSLMRYLRESGRYGEVPDSGYGDFVKENRDGLERVMAEGHDRYGRYLRETVGEPSRVTVVDATTMRFTSQRDLGRYLGHTEIKGCYYAVTAERDIGHVRYCDRTRQHLSSSYVNLAEFFLGSGEKPLADIGDDGKPVFDREVPSDEEVRIRAFPEIYDGIMECARHYSEMFGDSIPLISGEIMDGWIDVLISEEKGNDPETLSGIRWAVNTQHNMYKHLILRASDLPGAVLMKAAELVHSGKDI